MTKQNNIDFDLAKAKVGFGTIVAGIIFIIVVTFGFGVWATKISTNQDAAGVKQDSTIKEYDLNKDATNKRLDKIDGRLDTLDNKIDGRFDELEKKIDGMNKLTTK